MSWLTVLLPVLTNLLSSTIIAWNSSTSDTLTKVQQLVNGQAPPVLQALIQWGESVFPALKGVEAAAAALLTAAQGHYGALAWVQEGLNAVQSLGIVAFNGQGTTPGTNSPLTVDGVYGRLTKAALMAFQAKFGLPQTGVFSDAENTILTALSSGGLPAAINAAFAELVADIKKV